MRRILVTGAAGQIGTELTVALRKRYEAEYVVASDVRLPQRGDVADDGPFEHIDCTNDQQVNDVVRRYDVGAIYHLAALLSGIAEERPQAAWTLNMDGLYRVLEIARQDDCSVFFPSSIAAFGPSTPRVRTPQDTVQRPTSIYGVTKASGELLCDYYASRFGVDARGLRLPGLISYSAPPGGGTTDYAVEIFYQAIRYRHYLCFLRGDTRMDMMYMPDAIRAMIELMEADPAGLRHRNAFNLTAMNFTPDELAQAIRLHIPDFVIDYDVDPVRQAIADSWPQSVDDNAARQEWGWRPQYGLAETVSDIMENLGKSLRTARSERS